MPTVHLANDKAFAAAADASVLDAARQAGLVLEHSCRTGRCGTCRARVLEGRTVALRPDLALTAAERGAGWMLTCVAGAASDLRLDIEDLGLPADLQPRTLPCRIDALDRPAPDVAVVRLRLPPTAALRHLAGQYVDVIGKGGLRRSYSIANAPDDSGKLELHVRRVDDGVMSGYWFGPARVGDLLRLHGPLGTFFLRDTAGLHLVLLATGTGIAPIKALLGELALRPPAQQPRSVSLFWGNRTEADLYCLPDTLPLPAHVPALHYTPVLSRAGAAWTGARGHVQRVLLQRPFPWAETVVYACGSAAMIDSARTELAQAGLPARRFLSDAFVSSD